MRHIEREIARHLEKERHNETPREKDIVRHIEKERHSEKPRERET